MNPIANIPMVRVLNKEGKECLRGWYIYHINRQPAPFGDSLKEEDIEHLVAITSSADWNMPTRLELKRISAPYRIEAIQPTCTIEHVDDDGFHLSCGHTVEGILEPCFCSWCGAKVVKEGREQ